MSDAVSAALGVLYSDRNLAGLVRYTPKGGEAVDLPGRLSRPEQELEPSAKGTAALLRIPAVAFLRAGLARPKRGDAVEVGGEGFNVAAADLPAGSDVFVLALSR